MQFAVRATDAITVHNMAPAANHYDLVDDVMVAYQPLQELRFIKTALNGLNPVRSCAESVLILAMYKCWEDTEKEKEPRLREPQPDALWTEAPNGLTVPEMRRRLQHLPGKLASFPMYTFDAQTETFGLTHGKARSDGWAMMFIPADPPRLAQAHWTFGIVPDLTPIQHRIAPPPSIIYTRMPITEPTAFWRAEVCSENKVEYVERRALGLACDCEWWLVCQHEENWTALHPNAVRITLNDGMHVANTLVAQVVAASSAIRPITKGINGTVAIMSNGNRVCITNAHNSESIERRTMNFMFWRQMKYVDLQPVMRADFSPYRLALFRPDEDDIFTMFLPKSLGCFQRVACCDVVQADKEWAYHDDLRLNLPREKELIARLACASELSEAGILDRLRRLAAEEKWQVSMSRDELRLWITRTQREKGNMMPAPRVGSCWTCNRQVKTYRHECRECKHSRTNVPPEMLYHWDPFAVQVGFVGLWSKEFLLPAFELKPDAVLLDLRTKSKVTKDALVAICKRHEGPVSCRGRNVGPIFLNQVPTCFKVGPFTALQAILLRLAASRAHQASAYWYDRLFTFLGKAVASRGSWELEPETEQQIIDRMSAEKKQKMVDAQATINAGDAPLRDARVRYGGFSKSEKSSQTEMTTESYLALKLTEKPRFICCPDPPVLLRMGRYTHPQTKWLAHTFGNKDRMYYAGCSCPEELNEWLNFTLEDMHEPWTLADDITAIDANHSRESFDFHAAVRKMQFPSMPAAMEALFRSEETVSVKLAWYKIVARYVNASGVTDTSYKNSLICLVVRVFAIAHGYRDLRTPDWERWLDLVLANIWTAAAGDDGLTRLPARLHGIGMEDFSLARYREMWSWFGFGVKVSIIPPNRWRMATFLAMRPVWSGHRYEWAPEPARRMRGLFWQLDNTMHPIAFGRGVASQVYLQSRGLPVLSTVCQWYMRVTTGAIADVSHTSVYSPFHGSQMTTTTVTKRAREEFCIDYHVTLDDLDSFDRLLELVGTPMVVLNHYVLHRIYDEES